jgi:hypothetical protein
MDSENLAARLGIPAAGATRRRPDPLAAAVRLQTAVHAMQAAAVDAGPVAEDQADDDAATDERQSLGEAAAAAVQLGTHADQITAAEFAALVDPLQPATDQPAPEQEDLSSDRLELPAAVEDSSVSAAKGYADDATYARIVHGEAFSSERVMDWESRHDARSRDYGVAEHRLMGRAPIVDLLLPVGPVLNQGADGACAGFAAADAGNALESVLWQRKGYPLPPADLLGDADARAIYQRAKELDDVPGVEYSGTSILAAMKAGKEHGLWGGYLWAFGVRDIAQTLLQLQAPVVIGVPWFADMAETEPGGVVRVGGGWIGGHAVAIVGIQNAGPNGERGPFFVWQNSWGPGYGAGGLGYVHHRDLTWLLAQEGEAAIPQVNL